MYPDQYQAREPVAFCAVNDDENLIVNKKTIPCHEWVKTIARETRETID